MPTPNVALMRGSSSLENQESTWTLISLGVCINLERSPPLAWPENYFAEIVPTRDDSVYRGVGPVQTILSKSQGRSTPT